MRVIESPTKTFFLRFLLLLRMLLLLLPAAARAEQLPIKTYTIADGLARDTVNRIIQDPQGFLWFCTTEGLSRFDGYKFTTYRTDQGLPHFIVNDLLRTRNGLYWIATGSGVSLFNPVIASSSAATSNEQGHEAGASSQAAQPRFVVYRLGESEKTNYVNVLLEDRAGVIWCGTRGGLYRLEQTGGGWVSQAVDIGLPTVSREDNIVSALLEDREGMLWVGAGSGLYRRFSDGRVERYSTQQGLPSNSILSLLEDRGGKLWAGTGHGLCRIVDEPRTDQTVVGRVYTTQDGLAGNDAITILEAAGGGLWVGTYGGLSELASTATPDQEGRILHSYTDANGLSDRMVKALAEDRDGNLWVGTESGGAMKIARHGFINYGLSDGLGNNSVRVALRDRQGALWFGTQRGLSRLIPAPDPPRAPPPVMINGLRIAGITYAVSELGQTEVKGLELAASQNQIQIDFLGIDFTPSEMLRYQYKLEGADADWSAPTDQRTVNYANLSPGTYRFLVRAVNASEVYSQMPAGVAFRILPHIYQRWWFLTLCALTVGLVVFSIDRYRVARMRELNAALSESRQLTENLREQGAELHQVNQTLELQHTITDILAEAKSLKEAAAPILQAICRSVGWEMGALWHVDAQANVLRCVDVWHEPGTFDATEFERLSREFTFEHGVGLPGRVWASGGPFWINDINADDNFPRIAVAAKEGLSSAFGFPILLGGEVYGIMEFFSREPRAPDKEMLETMSTIGIQIGQLIERRRAEEALRMAREERLIELERVRKRIATDLHDDIGSSLTQISILSEVARQQVDHNNSSIAKPLKMIATASRELVDSMSDIVWAINPQKDHLSDLQQRMRRFASDVFTARNIDFRLRSPDSETDIQLGANLRREVFLIFKESINNMVKHSGCTRADIEFEIKADQLFLRLTDNGRGFDVTHESDGHGLLSMRERAKGIGAELEIISHEDSGTTTMLQVPLKVRRKAEG